MGSINIGRIVLGGLIAGPILFLSEVLFFLIFSADVQQQAANHNFMPLDGGKAIMLIAYVFGVAISAIWV